MNITGKTKQLALIGCPAEHSFSPAMHNFISEYIGNDYTYSAFTVAPENVCDAIKGMRALGICGMNVTAPHKRAVMEYLDEISHDAQLLNSVNTIVNRNGHLTGYSTDGQGFYMSLINAGIKTEGKNILVLGCGGVVIPALVSVIKSNPRSITLLNRTREKAEKTACEIYKITDYKIETTLSDRCFDVIINTTSAGMGSLSDVMPQDGIEELGEVEFISPQSAVVDMIYNPPKTKFLEYAQSRGAKILNGLDMLIYQGIIAYELFTDTKLPDGIADIIRKEVFSK